MESKDQIELSRTFEGGEPTQEIADEEGPLIGKNIQVQPQGGVSYDQTSNPSAYATQKEPDVKIMSKDEKLA